MTYSGWDALKDFLGMLGAVMIAIPWLHEFWLKKRRKDISDVRVTGPLNRVKNAIESSLREKIDLPKAADFVWTMAGLLMIFFSFLISLFRGVYEWFYF
jgi:hypothetical protein